MQWFRSGKCLGVGFQDGRCAILVTRRDFQPGQNTVYLEGDRGRPIVLDLPFKPESCLFDVAIGGIQCA
ncbi:MAG: hypothetical protein AAFX78_04985 [Cyanobacteria bacterium J06638_20]